MADRVLVTGINGFVGKHLARALTDAGLEVDGVIRERQLHPQIGSLVKKPITCDLVEPEQVKSIDFSGYRAIIHLAGLANVGASFKNPDLYMKVNIDPLVNICEALLEQKASPRIIAISTGAVYDPDQPMPLTEVSKTRPSSPYAASKLAMEEAAARYVAKGVDCIIVRPFNHIGPGQENGFIVPDMKAKITEALKTGKPVATGDLSTRRDYTDVRDVVKAYTLLARVNSLSSSIYNVCSGTTRTGEEIISQIKKNIPGAEQIKTTVDESLIRPGDPKELRGSNKLIKEDIGWSPIIPFEQTIRDALA